MSELLFYFLSFFLAHLHPSFGCMMQDFPINPLMNISGNNKFQFSRPSFLSTTPEIMNNNISAPLSFISGQRFYSGYSSLESLEFNEESDENEQGTFYKQSLTGFIPGDSLELINVCSTLDQGRWLVLLTDNMGLKRLPGLYVPLVCKTKYNSGKKPGESKGYSFEFSAQCRLRAPVYLG